MKRLGISLALMQKDRLVMKPDQTGLPSLEGSVKESWHILNGSLALI
jgi:hypothetical protein